MSAGPTVISEKRHKRLQRWRLRWIAERACRGAEPWRAASDRLVTTLAGSLPEADQAGRGTVLVACDRAYLDRFAEPFVRSIHAAGEPTRIHIHVCDDACDVGERIGAIAGRASSVALTWTAATEPVADGLAYRTIYYTAARFLLVPAVLRAARGPVLCLDVDALARRPLWPPIRDALASADIVVQERPGWKQATRRTVAGVVAFAVTDGGLAFADRLSRAIRDGFGIDPRYHLDQIAMTYLLAIMRRRGELRTAPVPAGYVDHEPGGDGVLWSAKGRAQKDSGAFADAQAMAGRAP